MNGAWRFVLPIKVLLGGGGVQDERFLDLKFKEKEFPSSYSCGWLVSLDSCAVGVINHHGGIAERDTLVSRSSTRCSTSMDSPARPGGNPVNNIDEGFGGCLR